MLPDVRAFEAVVDCDLLLGSWIGGKTVRGKFADADAAVVAAIGDVALAGGVLSFVGIDDGAEKRVVVGIGLGSDDGMTTIGPGSGRTGAGSDADCRSALRRGGSDIIKVVLIVEEFGRRGPKIGGDVAHPRWKRLQDVPDVGPMNKIHGPEG